MNCLANVSVLAATVAKILNEIFEQLGQGHAASKDFRDALGECAGEFVKMISSEANDFSEKENKKTIGPEHITAALKELGFDSYIGPVMDAADEHKRSMAVSLPVDGSSECQLTKGRRQERRSSRRPSKVA